MSHTPVGGHPQGWEHKLADRSSLPPAPGEEKSKAHNKHVFTQPQLPKSSILWREETEGSSASSARSPASPPYIRWARTLHDLLEDEEGVRLFRKFVSGAGRLHVERLNFYFAVHGLRQELDQHKIRQVVLAIYKFLRKSQLAMPEDLKQHLKVSLKDGSNIEKTVFDTMEQEVTRAITESTYQAFLHSDAYISYVSAATQPLSSPEESPPAPVKEVSVGTLATLHEGEELSGPPARLTHDALLATQTRRLRPDVQPSGAFGRVRSVYSAHVAYAGYCPASRLDSERASLSSGRTDSDAVSLSGSSLDGMSLRGVRESRHRPRHLDRHAVINKEQDIAMVIPRTQRIQSETFRALAPSEFVPILIEKLEKVKREQDAKERLERRLAEGDAEDVSCQSLPPQLVAAAIREKLQIDHDDDQDILDAHVSRVWSERTPGASPPGGRRRRAASALSADSGLSDRNSDLLHHRSRSSSKKTITELTDSGVSVVSERTAGRVPMWLADERRLDERRLAEERRLDERRAERLDYFSSRASSADREDHRRPRGNKNRTSGNSKSSHASSAVSGPMSAASGPAGEWSVVVVSFLDEPVPYRIRVPAAPLTLGLFKDYLPRKGNYRYFFKTECADLDNTVIQEEVSNDQEVLPMFEGKVMARVKSLE